MVRLVIITTLLAIFLYFSPQRCIGARYLIREKTILGATRETGKKYDYEEYLCSKMESIKYSVEGKKFVCFPEIIDSYSFEQAPEIILHTLYACERLFDGPEDLFQAALFNERDSSIFHFGDNLENFSNVFKLYIEQNIENKEKMTELFWLYLNTFSIENAYFILDDISDFDDICDFYRTTDDEEMEEIVYSSSKRKKDRKIIQELISPMKCKIDEGRIEIELFSWEDFKGKIEFWKFEIKDNYITLIEHEQIISKVGPVRF